MENKKLKTLKDLFESDLFEDSEYTTEQLQKLAREWCEDIKQTRDGILEKGTHEDCQYEDGQLDFIKHFFNLEDD